MRQPAENWPAYAYVPGKTPRHPEGAFDHLRQSVRVGMSAAELAKTAAFQRGLEYLEAGFFWECHELLEPVWMALPDESQERRLVQGLIQLANARLKLRMDRPKAALRLFEMARALVEAGEDRHVIGVGRDAVLREIDSCEQEARDAL